MEAKTKTTEIKVGEHAENLMRMMSMLQINGAANGVTDEMIHESTDRRGLIESHVQCARLSRSGSSGRYTTTASIGFQPAVNVEYIPENRVDINDLCKNVGTAMLGKYLFCRTITWPYKQNAVQTIVEDHMGRKAVLLSLYNYVMDEEFDPYSLPRGTPLLIKNPWFKLTGNGFLGLRCDNPQEISLFPGIWQDLDLTFNHLYGEEDPEFYWDWKARGSTYFQQKMHYNAIRAFTNGLQQNPMDAGLFSSRSAAFLNVGKPVFALNDSDAALKLEPGNVQTMWRKAVALCRIKKHKEAIVFLKKMIATHNSKELKDLLSRIEDMWEKGRLGQHNIEEAKKHPPGTYLNYVEYKGPVRVAKIEGKGRGLVATKEIPFGQLIIASRAFAISTHNSKSESYVIDCNVGSNIYKSPSYNKLITSLANILMTQPDMRKELYQLSAGSKLGYIEPKKGEMNLLVDMQRIEGICNINVFGSNPRDQDPLDYSGIWILPSFINHTCVDNNVTWQVYGDFMFVVALTKIKKGEEIMMPYFNALSEGSYEKCQQVLAKYEFKCECRLCQMGKDGHKKFII